MCMRHSVLRVAKSLGVSGSVDSKLVNSSCLGRAIQDVLGHNALGKHEESRHHHHEHPGVEELVFLRARCLEERVFVLVCLVLYSTTLHKCSPLRETGQIRTSFQ